jgi:arsenic resistance protein ArsH
MTNMPALDGARLPIPNLGASTPSEGAAPVRFLLLHGSARPESFSNLLCQEAEHILRHLGGETRRFDPAGLPTSGPGDHAKVKELRELQLWSEAQLWCSPENYGTMSAVMKAQLDTTPPVVDGVQVFQGKVLAVAQVCAAVQSFNTVSALAAVGRWIGMTVTPTQLCVPKVQEEFDTEGRMKPSIHYDRLVDLVEELFKTACLLRPYRTLLCDRYSTRAQAGKRK